MARQSQKSGTIKTTNPQSVTLAGTIQPFAGDTSSWPVINGVRQKLGWAVCEGDVLEQATYSQLFANLGSTWNAFNHPADGTPTVGGSQFALPNLKGLYLGGAGANGDSTFALGSFAADLTGVNGLSNSSSSVSVSGTTADDTHNHGITDPGHTHSLRAGAGSGPTTRTQIDPNNSSSYVYGTTDGNSTGITINNDTHSHTFTASGTASAQTISGDAETRPKTAPVGYIIALYDSVAAGALGLPEATADVSGIVSLNQAAVAPVNHIINGGDFWQRGTSFGDVQNTYTADRWIARRNGNTTGMDIVRSADFPSGATIRNSIIIRNDDGGSDQMRIAQPIESFRCYQLAGKKATFGLNFRENAGNSFTNAEIEIRYSTTPDAALKTIGGSVIPGATKTLTITNDGVWKTDSLTFDVPSDCAAMSVVIRIDTTGIDDDFRIHEPRLYEGDKLYDYVRAGGTYAGELALCQRYFYTPNTPGVGSTTQNIGMGYARGVDRALITVNLPVYMREFPTVSYSGAFRISNHVGGSAPLNVTSMVAFSGSNSSVILDVNKGTGTNLTAGSGVTLLRYLDSNATVGFSAEL